MAQIVSMSICWTAIACDLPIKPQSTVAAVVDGRTLKLDDGSELRLASLLAPTPLDSPASEISRATENEAIAALSQLVLQKSIAVKVERRALDRYGRRVGQAQLVAMPDRSHDKNRLLPEQRWLQARIVRSGHARVMLTPDTDASCAKILLSLEAKAEQAGVGIWKQALYRPKRAEDSRSLLDYRGTFQIVEGVVARVSISRSGAYLNFDRNWKRDFTVRIGRRALAKNPSVRAALKRLKRQPVRVRGWIERRNGPLIRVWRLEQIERLSVTPKGKLQRRDPLQLLLEPEQTQK